MRKLKVLANKDVDVSLWDACVQNSSRQGYEYVAQLNSMGANWLAFVFGNYDAVFPVFYRSKFGLKYAYQPVAIQQFSVCFKGSAQELDVKTFQKALNSQFRWCDICLSGVTLGSQGLRSNFFIPLNQGIDAISACFSVKTRPRLKKATVLGFECRKIDLADALVFLRTELSDKVQLSDRAYADLAVYFQNLIQRDLLDVRAVYINRTTLLCVGFFMATPKALVFVKGVANEAGRKLAANQFLLFEVMKESVFKFERFDFSGSSVPAIATFFKSFGATEEFYQRFTGGSLKRIINLTKRLLKK